MERLVTDSFRAVHNKIDPRRLGHSFEVLGYDFMIDENFKVLMIEANTNPSLEICSPLMARIIPELLDNSFRIAVDPLYQPPYLIEEKVQEFSPAPRTCMTGQIKEEDPPTSPQHLLKQPTVRGAALINGQGGPTSQGQKQRKRFELMPSIKYTLVFDERVDGPELDELQVSGGQAEQLLAEIQEEEKIGEVVAEQDEREQHEASHLEEPKTVLGGGVKQTLASRLSDAGGHVQSDESDSDLE